MIRLLYLTYNEERPYVENDIFYIIDLNVITYYNKVCN